MKDTAHTAGFPPARPLSLSGGAALWGVMFVGALLRAAWLGCGLPEIECVDAFKFTTAADAMARACNFEPVDFQYPAFFTNLLAVIYRAFHMTASPLAEAMIARAISAAAGVALIWLVWRGARRALSGPAALTASALAAVSTILVTISRFPMTDMLLTCLMTAGLLCALEEEPRAAHTAGAGVFLGLATATKWTGLYLGAFIALIAAVRFLRRRAMLREALRFAAVVLLAVVVFILVNPCFIPHWRDYATRLAFEKDVQLYGQVGRVQGGWADYFISSTPTWEMPWLSSSLLYTMGPVFLVALLAGAALAPFARGRTALKWHLLYAAAYLVLITGPGRIKAVRFLAPVLPSLFIVAASSVDAAAPRLNALRARVVHLAAALCLLSFPMAVSLRYVLAARRPMTQFLAADWFRENVPPGANLFISPFFLGNLWQLPYKGMEFQYLAQYRVPGDPANNAELNPQYGPRLMDSLNARGVQYVVSNSYYDGAFQPISENLRWFPNATAAYAGWRHRLETEGTLVWSARAADNGRLGPDIEVWRLRAARDSSGRN